MMKRTMIRPSATRKKVQSIFKNNFSSLMHKTSSDRYKLFNPSLNYTSRQGQQDSFHDDYTKFAL